MYPRPWTHSLFVSELALRSTRVVRRRQGRPRHRRATRGLMMSLDDGHVTTIAVDPAWHRHGIGTRLLLALAREAIERDATALTLEVRLSNQGAQELYKRFGFTAVGVRKGYYADTGEDALVMWAYEVERAAVRAGCSTARARRAGHDRRRAAEAVGDAIACGSSGSRRRATRPRRRSSTTAATVRSSVVASQADLHARFGGVVPEIASRAHVELISDVIEEALVEAGTTLADLDAVAAVHGPGLAGALLVGVSAAKAIALADGPAVRRRAPSRSARVRGAARGPDARTAARDARRVGRPHAADRDGRPRPLPGARPDGRRRGGRGVRQGRPVPRPRLSRRSGDRPARRERRPAGDRVPAADARRRPRLLVLGPEDRGRALRPQAPRRRGRRRRRVVPGRGRRRARRRSCCGAARETGIGDRRDRRRAWPPTRRCGPGCSTWRPTRRAAGRAAELASAPTTRRWWPRSRAFRLAADGPTALDGARSTPNLPACPSAGGLGSVSTRPGEC